MKRQENKILLIEPPLHRLFKDTYSLDRYPLGLGYLAGTIKKETNWSVLVYNADFHARCDGFKYGFLTSVGFESYVKNLDDLSRPIWDEIRTTIKGYNPTVVGVSAVSPNFKAACHIARFAKEINRQIIVIVGGPHPSAVGADVMNCPDIDVAVKGEGEFTMIELLNAIEERKEFDGIQGIIFRKNGEIVETSSRAYLKDLDSLCFPHEYAPEVLKDYDKYPVTAFKYIYAGRGCPYNCLFCGSRTILGQRPRFRSPENVVKEIVGLQRKGVKVIHFANDVFATNKEYIHDLCEAMKIRCRGLRWSCEQHVKLIDEQSLALMKSAGCYMIMVGIESGSNEILRAMRKNITIEEAFIACESVKKSGIKLEIFFMVGFPMETEGTLNETLAAIRKIKPDRLVYSTFTPYPGTENFEFCKEKGVIDNHYDISLHHHQSPVNCFSANIPPDRFRTLVSKIEKMVDKTNWLKDIKKSYSYVTIKKIQELGFRRSLKKAARKLIGV